jgi:hypothetical protein
MPVHDWTRVEAGIFHAFHHIWIDKISEALNEGVLPPQYYALPEQMAAGFGPDVLALEMRSDEIGKPGPSIESGGSPLMLLESPPEVRLTAETEMEYYRRKQSHIAVRHVSDDSLVAVIEVVSPGNKASRKGLSSFLEKVAEFLERQIHLLILDVLPPTSRDPQGIRGVIWDEITGHVHKAPADEPLTLVAYESAAEVRAYIEPLRVGGLLRSMPLYLKPGGYVLVPLERT